MYSLILHIIRSTLTITSASKHRAMSRRDVYIFLYIYSSSEHETSVQGGANT